MGGITLFVDTIPGSDASGLLRGSSGSDSCVFAAAGAGSESPLGGKPGEEVACKEGDFVRASSKAADETRTGGAGDADDARGASAAGEGSPWGEGGLTAGEGGLAGAAAGLAGAEGWGEGWLGGAEGSGRAGLATSCGVLAGARLLGTATPSEASVSRRPRESLDEAGCCCCG